MLHYRLDPDTKAPCRLCTFFFSLSENHKLNTIAATTGLSRSAVLRELIIQKYRRHLKILATDGVRVTSRKLRTSRRGRR